MADNYKSLDDDWHNFTSVSEAESMTYYQPCVVSVKDTGRIYQFDPASIATRDGINVLAPAGGGRLLATNGFVYTDEVHLKGTGSESDPIEHSQDTTDLFRFFVGAITTGAAAQCSITSDGSIVTASVQSEGGGDIRYVTLDGYASLDCTPPATVQLTAGSNSNPVENFIYIDILDGLLKKSTTGFPATSHVPLDRRIIPSASFVQANGTYPGNNFSDHVFTTGDNGHLTHINQNFRKRPPVYLSGASVTISGSGTATCTVAVSSGLILMNHERLTKSFPDGSSFLVANDETNPYQLISNLYSLSTDTTGATLTGRWAAHFLWYGHAQEESGTKLFLNKPSGTYLSADETRSDSNGYFNSSVPPAFRGCAIGLRRIVARKSATGTIEINYKSSDDWRGKLLSSVPGSGGTTSFSSVFPTSDFRLHDPADASKEIAFDASAISTGQTRTISMPDRNVDLAPASREATTSQSGLMSATHVTDLVTAKKSILDNDGDTKIQVEESADEDKIRFDTAGTERMIIDSSGNVGINQTSPTAKTHIKGTGSTSGTTAFKVDNSSNAELFALKDDGNISLGSFSLKEITMAYDNGGTGFAGGSIWQNGASLFVFGESRSASAGYMALRYGGSNGTTGGSSALWQVINRKNGVDINVIAANSDQNVGIGTTSQTARTHIKGSTSDNTAYCLKLDSSSNAKNFYVRNDGQIDCSGSVVIGFQTFISDSTLTQSSKYTAVTNPSGEGMVLTLHLSPPDGIIQTIVNASAYSVTIGRNGQKIAGLESNYTLAHNSSIVLHFFGATLGWLITSNG